MSDGWNYLDPPVKAGDIGYDRDPPWPGEIIVQLLVREFEDGEETQEIVLGDWIDIPSDEGCGCCSSGRPETVLAWRELRPVGT